MRNHHDEHCPPQPRPQSQHKRAVVEIEVIDPPALPEKQEKKTVKVEVEVITAPPQNPSPAPIEVNQSTIKCLRW